MIFNCGGVLSGKQIYINIKLKTAPFCKKIGAVNKNFCSFTYLYLLFFYFDYGLWITSKPLRCFCPSSV